MRLVLAISLLFFVKAVTGQGAYWQQQVKYRMDVDMDVNTNRFKAVQKLTYTNNSPDTLDRVFYHLYWNAFQPGSMMDERSRRQGTVDINGRPDWDNRVADRIQNLKPNEIGYQKILSLAMNGAPQTFKVNETILEVSLTKPILPRQKVVFDMNFEAQVPLQIRRSGRDNPGTKVRYSISQWYPKLCAYDKQGWHPTQYIGREFYGVFGDYDVNITIDKNYILGGTGYLANAGQIGYGYEPKGTKVTRPAGNTLTWKFTAPNVHDFMWAGDPGFVHKTKTVRPDLVFHLLYKPGENNDASWEKVLTDATRALPFIEQKFGRYTYKQFSFIAGGDGGMEYPMSTLLFGPGAWLHEWLHNWFYGVLGTNEAQYPWMDEGFTTYAENLTKAYLDGEKGNAFEDDYRSYNFLVKSGKEEPMSTFADHFNTNFAYSVSSYVKGSIFLNQLSYITGQQVFDNIMLNYYNRWKFKQPDPDDFINVAEKASGMQLNWYKEFWIYTTKHIDYAIDSLWEDGGKTNIRLRNDDQLPMPVDFVITTKNGDKELHYIPLGLMFNEKPVEDPAMKRMVYKPWAWTSKKYVIQTDIKIIDIKEAEIDPSQRMADINRRNNKIVLIR